MKSWLIVFIAAPLVTACVSAPAPVSVGPGTFMIMGANGTGFTSNAALLTDTIRRANEFCAKDDGKIAQVIDSSAAGSQGWSVQNAKATFKCVPKPA